MRVNEKIVALTSEVPAARITPRGFNSRRTADVYERAMRPQGGNSTSRLERDIHSMKTSAEGRDREKKAAINTWANDFEPRVEASCSAIEALVVAGKIDEAEVRHAQQSRELATWIAQSHVESAVVAGLRDAMKERMFSARTLIDKHRSDEKVRELANQLQSTRGDLSTFREDLKREQSCNEMLVRRLQTSIRQREQQVMIDRAAAVLKTTVREAPTGSRTISYAFPQIRFVEPGPGARNMASALVELLDSEELIGAAVDDKIHRKMIAQHIVKAKQFSAEAYPALHRLFVEHAEGLQNGCADESTIPAALTANIQLSLKRMAMQARGRLRGQRELQIRGIRQNMDKALTPELAKVLAARIHD